MKKILFINKYPTCVNENLKKKFDGQMEACLELGYEVWFLKWDGKFFKLCSTNSEEEEKIIRTNISNLHRYYHTLYFFDLNKACKAVIRKHKFDYVYMRYMPFLSSSVSLAKQIKKQEIKFLMEIPSYRPENEEKN